MLSKKCALFAAVLLSVSGFGAAAADNEESLWSYADPSADVVLYINTKQPEKAMDKDIWDRIQKDKDKALKEKEKDGDSMFDMKNRDMEVIVNVRLASVTPFRGTIEGVANISGNMQGDIDKMMEMLNQPPEEGTAPQPQVSKKNDMNFYNLNLKDDENTQNTDIMIVPVTPNQLHFRVNINPSDPMAQTLVKPPAATGTTPSEGFAKFVGQDVALACYLIPDKLAELTLTETDAMEVMGSFLKKVSDVALSAQVSGPLTMLKGAFTFKSETNAAEFAETAKEVLPTLQSYLGTEQAPRSALNGKVLELTIPFNTSDAWDMISRLTDENGALDFFGIDPESEDPKPTKVGNEKKTTDAQPAQTE